MLRGRQRNRAIKWICNELSRLLKREVDEDEADNLLSVEKRSHLENRVKSIVDFSSPRAEPFLNQILKFWDDDHKDDDENKSVRCSDMDVNKGEIEKSGQGLSNKSSKAKKAAFVPLFGTDGKDRTAAKLPGRHRCECQASKHELVNNCLECGRIVCEQEGSGPCLFCGTLVCSNKEQEILSLNSKKSLVLKEKLMNRPQIASKVSQSLGAEEREKEEFEDESLKQAIKHKDKLLDYDRNSIKRTHVIDDENDYFSTNKWQTEEEKKLVQAKLDELRSLRFGSRIGPMKVTLDLIARKVVETEREHYDVTQDRDIMAANFGTSGRNEEICPSDGMRNNQIILKPEFIQDEFQRPLPSHRNTDDPLDQNLRLKVLQDSDIQMTIDQGKALSMHQPWASLLVAGIKKHEGRSWYTNHRGPLWIASTAKRPELKEIENVEAMYRALYHGKKIKFPEIYPSGVLLGRVVVTDCLAQEEYRSKYPNGESESPYVFICENPIEMNVRLPFRGRQKIYSLDAHIHTGARKMLDWKEPQSGVEQEAL